ARLDLGLGVLLHILRERATHVVALVEATLFVAAHVTLVRARVYQLAFTLLRHAVPPCSFNFTERQVSAACYKWAALTCTPNHFMHARSSPSALREESATFRTPLRASAYA